MKKTKPTHNKNLLPSFPCSSNLSSLNAITDQEMSNQGAAEAKAEAASSNNPLECCMCGDYGLPNELFRCKICLFRFQHRYCSDLYPKADSYLVCNWCLKRKGRKIVEDGANNSSAVSSPNSSNRQKEEQSKNRRNDGIVGLKAQRDSLQHLHLQNPMKKQRSPEQSSVVAPKRIITNGCLEQKLRRNKSLEESPKSGNRSGIIKHVFRGKVRRYKLLDEVAR